jgi:L-malate glycosyltransferase
MMNIAFLAPANSIHTVRWANALSERNCKVTVITMHKPEKNAFHSNVQINMLPFKAPLGYYLNFISAKKVIEKLKPDLLHVHYASGYGTLSRLVNFRLTLLSVWGSDVFEFPYQSESNRKTLIKNLKAADKIASTSWVMKQQTENFYQPPQEIAVTPFGIDMTVFKPLNTKTRNSESITIGMVKMMESKYGPQYLLEAIPLLLKKLNQENMPFRDRIKVLMVGGGGQIAELEKMAEELGIRDIVAFTGEIPHSDVPKYLNSLDIYCAPSEMESFGVAVIEASACEIPVIVSNVGGLPEVVKDGETGFIVEPKNPFQIAEKLFELISDHQLRRQFGENGRRFVQKNYNWDSNVSGMVEIYKNLIGNME